MKVKLASVLTLVAVVATFLGVIWWSTRGQGDARVASAAVAAAAKSTGTQDSPVGGSVAPASRNADPLPAVDAEATASEASFREFVNTKYRYLFRDSAMKPEAREALLAALVEREHIATLIRTAQQSNDAKDWEAVPKHQAELAAIEQKIGALLPPVAITAFDLLKDSDREQYQLESYAGGATYAGVVSEDEKQKILIIKLTYRQRFQRVLEESRLLTGELTPEQRKHAFKEVSRALEASRDNYLQEVRQYLYNEEHYQLLSDYEKTEFAEELESLRKVAYGE